MHARERLNEAVVKQTADESAVRPVAAKTAAAVAPAGATGSRDCLFCRYRRAPAQEMEAAHA